MNRDENWLLAEKYAGVESEAFHADRMRLAAGEPLGYVIGFVPFLNTKIYLDSSPLIPRPETEYWTELAIKEIQRHSEPKVLDLCAGSGAIGVAVAKAIPEAHVTFGEIDKAHLPTIKNNLAANTFIHDSEKYSVLESNVFEHISGQFDFILSNPPYIDPKLDRTEPSVKQHEPHLALYGGDGGLTVIETIIGEALHYLKPKGQLWIEHEPEQSRDIQQCAASYSYNAKTHEDQFGIERFTTLMLQ